MTRFAAKTFFATVLVFLLCSVSLTQTPTNTTVYIYDEVGRLKAVITPSGDTAIYSYDAAGNIVSITRQSSNLVSVIEFTPDQGAVGTAVTIYGTGFSLVGAENTVQFNGVAATVTAASATQLIAVVPAGATTGPITVTTPTGSVVSTTNFEVLQNLSITNFSPIIGTPGTAVQITGTNFDPVPANDQPKFNVTTASAIAATSTTIDTTVPAGATSGHISLTTPAGSTTSTGDFFVPPSPYTAASVDFAGRIAFGETKTFSVNAANRIALLVFDGTAGQRLSLQAANSTISSSTIGVMNPDGSNLLNPTSRSGNWFIDTLTLPVTGTYTILIDPNSTFTGTMSFTLHNVPADVSGTIIPSGPPVSINITVPGQNANLSFAGTAGQRISLNLTNVSISSSSVSIRRANGTTLVSSSVTPSGIFFDSMVLPATENYSIVVDPTGPAIGAMTLSLSDVSADVNGTIVIGGAHVVVTITTPGQNAQLTFTGTAGQIIELDRQGTVSFSGSSQIRKPDGTVLQDNYGFSFSDQIYLLPVTGTYTIDINPANASTGNVTFALYEIPQPVTGTLTANGPPLAVTIPVNGQIANITFQGTAGEQVSLKINNIKTGPFGLYVEVQGPDGSFPGFAFADPEFFYDDDYFDYYNFIDTMVLPATGTYTIAIWPDFGTTGSMDLTLYTVPLDITATITPGGPPVTVTTTVPGQDARLTFSGTEGQRISMKVSSVFPFTPYNCLLGPDGFVVGGTACVPNFQGRTSFLDTVVLPTTGTYTIRVNGIYAGFGTATVNLYDLPPVITGTLTVGGPPVTVTATAPGQDAEMTFTGTAGQRVSLKVSGTLPLFSNVAIFSGNNLFPLNPGNRFIRQLGPVRAELIETLVLPTSGTYRVRVNTWNDVGNMTFNLYEVPADVSDGVITVGGPPVTVTATAERQNRRLTFAGTAGQVVNLKINNDVSWLNHVWIHRPDGIVVASVRADAAGMKVIDAVLPVNGTYSILTELFANGDAVTLTLGSGRSDVTGTAILDGQPTIITVPASQQVVRHNFNGTAGQKIGIRSSDVTLPDAPVTIDGQELECCLQHIVRNEGHGRDRFSVRQVAATGPNALVVDPFGDGTGSVTTRLYDVPPDVTDTITPNASPVTVTTTIPGQNANLMFNGTTGQQVTIHVTNNTVGKITIEVFRPTGVQHTYYLSSGGSFDLPVQSLPTPGAYSIIINPWRANTGSVTVSVTSP